MTIGTCKLLYKFERYFSSGLEDRKRKVDFILVRSIRRQAGMFLLMTLSLASIPMWFVGYLCAIFFRVLRSSQADALLRWNRRRARIAQGLR